jgi:hypothetical protein
MAMDIGDSGALGGMTKAIYDKLNELLTPKVPADALPAAQAGWKEIAFAVATGVVTHLHDNLAIAGLSVSGTADLTVSGTKATGTVTLIHAGPTTGLVR